MKKLILLGFLSIGVQLFAQGPPEIVLTDSSRLKLTTLKIDVKIVGNFAFTTYDMKFYNELDRTLEGELVFPLGEGQAVSRFAMDVNDKLREAVIVEKELARVAFESTVRQNIDPGLLEKTEGNNYKARIYPILPEKHKHIVLTFEQELSTLDQIQTYVITLGIKEALDEFSVHIEIPEGQGLPMANSNTYENFLFKEDKGVFTATLKKQNHCPTHPIIFQIPNKRGEDRVLSYNDYFHIYQTLIPDSRLKAKPNKISLLWDASYSMRNRNLVNELELLDDYFRYLQNVEIQFISFSNDIQLNTIFKIEDGNWVALKKAIKSTIYDGGTSMNKFETLDLQSDELLLFSDGLANLGDFSKENGPSVYAINSIVSANHETLNSIATKSGGSYINLVRLPYVEAVEMLKKEVFQYLGADHDNSVSEIYPKTRVNVSEDFSLAGKFNNETSIELLFGYRGEITQRINVSINTLQKSEMIKRLWAKQKLSFLNQNKEKNREEIISLAKQYHLVTDYTSMLILDRIEDYVRYRIEPPKELRAEYKENMHDIEEEEAERLGDLMDRREGIFEDYQDILEWYSAEYPKRKIKERRPEIAHIIDQVPPSTRRGNSTHMDSIPNNGRPTSESVNINIDPTRNIVSGTVLDSYNRSLPGAYVVVKGTTNGTTTDFDGNFIINADENDVLIFSYVGFSTATVVISNDERITISLQEDAAHLDEVVVTGMGVQMVKHSLASSVSEVVSRSLAGQVTGVRITMGNRDERSDSDVQFRGMNSISNDNSPLYIVDGSIVDNNPVQELKPEKIAEIQVLKALNASAIYGARAQNGVIIITTKKGLGTDRKAIEALNQQITEKIELKPWNPHTPYIKILEKESTTELAYDKYLEIRDDYSNSPSFYMDVSDFFDLRGRSDIAITVLSNLIEIELNDHEIIKALAYKLEYFAEYDLAVTVYKKVLELRPEDPQSYRDLALAYELAGKAVESFDLLYKLYNGELLDKDEEERYYGIEQIVFVELTRLVNKYGKKIKLDKAQKEKFREIPVDIRVVIDWNHNDTDIDLWVEDPKGEKAYYKNSETRSGGRISEDMTEGYGPEEFMIRNSPKGVYKVLVDYYADNVQKISGPTVLKVTFFTNYGRANEVRKTSIVRLDKEEDEIEVGTLRF
tara:strand:+ start:7042 stop:10488 length:3447 start_codon:yes stop_codon:yes gene_type:complete